MSGSTEEKTVIERGKEIDKLYNELNLPAYIKTKVDEAKGKIDAVEKSVEPKIFNILRQTKRGRLLCWMLGLKDESQKRKRNKRILMKSRKLKKIIDNMN